MIKELAFLKKDLLEFLDFEGELFSVLAGNKKDISKEYFLENYRQVKIFFLMKDNNLKDYPKQLKKTKLEVEDSAWERQTNSELFSRNNKLGDKWEKQLLAAGHEYRSVSYFKEMDKLKAQAEQEIHYAELNELLNNELEYWLMDNVLGYVNKTEEEQKKIYNKHRQDKQVMLLIKKMISEKKFEIFEVLKFNKLLPARLCSIYYMNPNLFHAFTNIRLFLLQRKVDGVWEVFGQSPFKYKKQVEQLFNLFSEVRSEIPIQSIVSDLNSQGELKTLELNEVCIEESFQWVGEPWQGVANFRTFKNFQDFRLEYLIQQKQRS